MQHLKQTILNEILDFDTKAETDEMQLSDVQDIDMLCGLYLKLNEIEKHTLKHHTPDNPKRKEY